MNPAPKVLHVCLLVAVTALSLPTGASADGLGKSLAGYFGLHGVKRSDKIKAPKVEKGEAKISDDETTKVNNASHEVILNEKGEKVTATKEDGGDFWAKFREQAEEGKDMYENGELVVANKQTGRRTTIGVAQNIEGTGEERENSLLNYEMSLVYLKDRVLAEDIYSESYFECKNTDALCSFWASTGECDKNRAWMVRDGNCALACMQCQPNKGKEPTISDVAILGVKKDKKDTMSNVEVLGTLKEDKKPTTSKIEVLGSLKE